MQLIGAGAKPRQTGQSDGGAIKDSGLETFAQDVIETSMTIPVIVDFWAPWCGPCKQLTPILEKVVEQAKGKVRLVKVNIDENPEIAQQLRIQSIPTVYAFVGGQPVTGFTGAQPESQIRALVEKLAGAGVGNGGDIAGDLEAAKQAAEAGDLQTAAALYDAVLREEPANPEAIGGLARCMVSAGQLADAEEWLGKVPAEHANHAAIAGARAALTLAKESGEVGDPAALAMRLDRDENDHEARYQLATALFLRGQTDQAMEHLAKIVKQDREWSDDGARKQMVKFFEALGPKHPSTLKGRRMLSSMLFS